MKRLLASFLLLPLCALGSDGCSSNENTGTTDGSAAVDMASGSADLPASDGSMPADLAQRAVPTEVMVVRVGTGSGALTANVATAAFIERRMISDGSLVGQALALPTAVSGTNRPLTLSGQGISEGALTRSVDGRYVLIAGYDAAPGATSVIDTAMRVAGRIAADGTINTSTQVDGLNGTGNNIRSAISTDGNAIWLGGVLGVAYTTLGSTGMPAAKPLGSVYNSRVLGIYDGQLYVSRQSDTSGGLNAVGTGLPMANNVTPRQLTGFPTTGNVLSPFGFVGFDRDSTQGIDVLYIADDRTDGNGGVQQWKLSGTTWTLAGTFSAGTMAGCRGLTGYLTDTGAVLIATTAEQAGGTRVIAFTDNGGTPASTAARTLATAAANTAFRGVSLPPM